MGVAVNYQEMICIKWALSLRQTRRGIKLAKYASLIPTCLYPLAANHFLIIYGKPKKTGCTFLVEICCSKPDLNFLRQLFFYDLSHSVAFLR